MRKDLIKMFKCPECGSELALKEVSGSEREVIIDGTVICKNNHEFKIENRVLILFEGG